MPLPWLSSRAESNAARTALLPLDLAALAYQAGASLHRSAYERGWIARRRLSCRVVSVGNLTVGGSGKTPTTAWLAVGLRRRGHKVAIASRGYRRPSRARRPGARGSGPLGRGPARGLRIRGRRPGARRRLPAPPPGPRRRTPH